MIGDPATMERGVFQSLRILVEEDLYFLKWDRQEGTFVSLFEVDLHQKKES